MLGLNMLLDNHTFLQAVFGESAPFAHVTGFSYDPSAIPEGRHLAAWAGGYAKDVVLREGDNQYFTISTFTPDERGVARRRKANFIQTHAIVLDDVKEKLSEEAARRLPEPTWILETSNGSEQWGYTLTTPCTDRTQVENLLDGLVANGLAPDGKDPGMKGVTRYVRLPGGSNTKASKAVFGMPFKSKMVKWNPELTCTMEELAAPFSVDLFASRRDTRVDGAAYVDDHPVLELVHVKEVRSDGRYDITCPWVDEHTGGADDGAGMFTNGDGSLGFKCHHGACQERTGADLIRFAEEQAPGTRARLAEWKMNRLLGAPVAPAVPAPAYSFIDPPAAPAYSFIDPPAAVAEQPVPTAPVGQGLSTVMDDLRKRHPTSREAKELASTILRAAEEMPTIDRLEWQEQVRDVMGWNKTDAAKILRDLKDEWYTSGAAKEFYNEAVFVKELNQFYVWRTRTFMTVEAFSNANMHEDPEARKGALQDGHTVKVDRLDYAPGEPRIFTERGITYANMYMGIGGLEAEQGDASPWLDHWDKLGWGEHRDHMLKYMAFTILHPEYKINHMMILGSREGCGKDFLLYPLLAAMGEDARVIDGDALAENYTGYLNGVKYLHINEAELGNRQEALSLANKLKPIAAAPPETLRVRELFTKPYYIRNLVNGTMTTNSRLPLRAQETRRFFAVWSDLQTRGDNGSMTPEWLEYWGQQWEWMKGGGAKACIWYLRNCVDISDFKPGAPPPVTQFLREIQDDSKPPVQRTLEAFIEQKIGAFALDLVTARDALDTLKAGELVAPELMFTESKNFNVFRLTQAMRDIGAEAMRAKQSLDEVRVWCIRNRDKWEAAGPSMRYTYYHETLASLRAGTGVKLVQ